MGHQLRRWRGWIAGQRLAEAFWRAGGDVAVALIGPGVDASHNYERTHLEALIATTQWIIAYLLS